MAQSSPRSRRWRLLLVLVGVVALIWFAPAIVAFTPLKQTILNAVFGDLKGTTRVGGASLGWLSPVVLENVELRDAEGRTLFSIPKLRSSASLISLVTNHSDLGTFIFERPTVHVVWDEKQTNFETTLAAWLRGSSESSTPLAVRLQVQDGQLIVESATTKEKRTLDKVQFDMNLTPFQLAFRGSEQSAEIDVSYASKDSPTPSGELKLMAKQWPLVTLAPLLGRSATQLEGVLNGSLAWQWEKDPARPPVRLESSLIASNVKLSTAALGPDQLRLDRLEFPCTVKAVGNDVAIERADVICDIGKASLSGVLDLAAAPFDQKNSRISADVDLAKLANLFPASLRLRKDTRLISGRLMLDAQSQPRDGRAVWQGKLRTTDLQAMHNGQPLSWQQPIAADFNIYSDKNGMPVVERLRCDSSFLQIDASGSATQWSAKANYDLEQLVKELSRFVDLKDIRAGGKGWCKLANTQDGDRFRVSGESQTFNLVLGNATSLRWQEPQLTIQVQAAGTTSKNGPLALDTANLAALAGADELGITLAEPVSDLRKHAKASFRAKGDLARWQRRLQTFVPDIESWLIAGNGEVTGRVGRDANAIALNDVNLKAQNLRLKNTALNVFEPTFEAHASARWQADSIDVNDLKVTSSTLGASFPKTTVKGSGKSIEIVTRGAVQGHLGRLQSWFQQASSPSSAVTGEFTGKFDVHTQAEVIAFKTDIKLKDFGFVSSTWRDPEVRLTCTTRVDPVKDFIALDNLQIETPALATTASGKIVQWSSRKDLSLAGQVRYDLEKLEPHLRAVLGPSVKVTGRDSRPFHLQGSLAAASPTKPLSVTVGQSASQSSWTGEFGASWQSFTAFNCQLGPAEIKGRITNGLVQFQPIDTTFNQGRFKLQPTLRFDPTPAEMTFAKGWMVERARLTPAVSSGALSYAVPILAGVAEADGQISVHLDSGKLPLGDAPKADLAGQIHIHNARVGPSAMVRELSTLLIKGNQHFSIASNSVVPFQLVKGRVYHRDLEIVFPEVKVRTHGSVGLDGSLAILAEMPIPPKWLGSGRISQALAKQTIRLPIGGTLERPRLDEAAVRNISAQVTRDLAADVIRQELENSLKKLFDPKK